MCFKTLYQVIESCERPLLLDSFSKDFIDKFQKFSVQVEVLQMPDIYDPIQEWDIHEYWVLQEVTGPEAVVGKSIWGMKREFISL